jgi:HPt (histidine-containing phosphotransfer) domain-containing protein
MNQAREAKVVAARTRMAELAAKFLERSLRELAVMRDGLARLQAGESVALGDLRHLAHRMCGTGATLGFNALGDCAARVERLAECCPAGSLPDAAALTQLGVGVEALATEIARLDAANKIAAGT